MKRGRVGEKEIEAEEQTDRETDYRGYHVVYVYGQRQCCGRRRCAPIQLSLCRPHELSARPSVDRRTNSNRCVTLWQVGRDLKRNVTVDVL